MMWLRSVSRWSAWQILKTGFRRLWASDFRFGLSGSGFRVLGSAFRCLGFRASGSAFRCLGFRALSVHIQLRVPGSHRLSAESQSNSVLTPRWSKIEAEGDGFQIEGGLGFWVWGLGL